MPAIAQSACGSRKIWPSALRAAADRFPGVIVGAQEPLAVPALRLDGRRHRVGGGAMPRCRRLSPSARESAAYSRAASTKSAAIITDSARPALRIGAVWKDSSGSVECALRLRQSFQSARPISGSPCAPRRVQRVARARPPGDRASSRRRPARPRTERRHRAGPRGRSRARTPRRSSTSQSGSSLKPLPISLLPVRVSGWYWW